MGSGPPQATLDEPNFAAGSEDSDELSKGGRERTARGGRAPPRVRVRDGRAQRNVAARASPHVLLRANGRPAYGSRGRARGRGGRGGALHAAHVRGLAERIRARDGPDVRRSW
jgi:hypothetical protein